MTNATIYSSRLGESPSGTGNGTKATINSARIKEILNAEYGKPLHTPKSYGDFSKGPATRFIDLLKRKQLFTLTGNIGGSTADSANIVVKNIREIFNAGGNVIVNIEGIVYTCAVMKSEFEHKAHDRVCASTTNAETAGSDVVIEVNTTNGFVVGDSISIIGGAYGSEKCEMTSISAVSSTTITATLANSYDAVSYITKHTTEVEEYSIMASVLVATNITG